MKKIFITGLVALAMIGCSENTTTDEITDENSEKHKVGYTIQCDFGNTDISKAYLSQYEKGEWNHKDSVDVVDGKFAFKGELILPEIWYLRFDDKKEYIPVFVENSSIAVSGISLNKDSVLVEGSAIHNKMETFNKKNDAFYIEMNDLYEKYLIAEALEDTTTLAQIDRDYEATAERQGEYIKGFISENSESVLAPYLVVSHLLSGFSTSEMDSTLATFSSNLDGSKYIISIRERYEKLKMTDIGISAPLFTQNDVDGNPISLESLKGQYVLLDFWASWCGPCRKENPNVVAAYEKYKDKGFTILGISLDDNKEKWMAAIEKDGLTWSHISDLKGWKNEIAQQYGVNGIPHSILLDRKGIIVAKNLRGEDLHDKLEEVLNTDL